jgi:hypothetical protein
MSWRRWQLCRSCGRGFDASGIEGRTVVCDSDRCQAWVLAYAAALREGTELPDEFDERRVAGGGVTSTAPSVEQKWQWMKKPMKKGKGGGGKRR